MTSSQKRWAEWPLLAAIFFVSYGINLFLTGQLGGWISFSLLYICNSYFVVSRNIFKGFLLVFLLSWFTTPMVGIDPTTFIATQVFCGLVAKLILMGLAVEGRQTYAFTTMGIVFVQSVVLVIITLHKGFEYSLWVAVGHSVTGALIHGLLAYYFYPFCLFWDEYFEHEPELSSHSSFEEVRG